MLFITRAYEGTNGRLQFGMRNELTSCVRAYDGTRVRKYESNAEWRMRNGPNSHCASSTSNRMGNAVACVKLRLQTMDDGSGLSTLPAKDRDDPFNGVIVRDPGVRL